MINETTFIKQLRNSFKAIDPDCLTWKLRGTAATAGRPDLLVVSQGQTFMIETKVKALKKELDLMELPTTLQKTIHKQIIAAGGQVFLATLITDTAAIVIDLTQCTKHHKEFPETFYVKKVDGFIYLDHLTCPFCSFTLTKKGSLWAGVNQFTSYLRKG